MRKYSFFYHFNKQKNLMTVHWRGQCLLVKNIECSVPSKTRWSDKQPKIVMCGKATNVIVEDGVAKIV